MYLEIKKQDYHVVKTRVRERGQMNLWRKRVREGNKAMGVLELDGMVKELKREVKSWSSLMTLTDMSHYFSDSVGWSIYPCVEKSEYFLIIA